MPMAAPLPVTSALTTEIAEWVTAEDSFNGGIRIVALLSPSTFSSSQIYRNDLLAIDLTSSNEGEIPVQISKDFLACSESIVSPSRDLIPAALASRSISLSRL